MRKAAAPACLALICSILLSACVSQPRPLKEGILKEIPLQEFPLRLKFKFKGCKRTEITVTDHFGFTQFLESPIKMATDSSEILVTGKMLRPGFIDISIYETEKKTPWHMEYYAANGDTVTLEYDMRTIRKDRIRDYPLANVTSGMQEDLAHYMHIRDSLYGAFMDRKMDLKAAMIKAIEKGNEAEIGATAEIVNAHSSQYKYVLVETAKTYVASRPLSPVTVFVLEDLNISQYDPAYGFAVYKSLPDSLRNSPYGEILNQELMKDAKMRAAIGTKLGPVYGETLAGAAVNTDSIVRQSKYTLVTFWATWCGSCIQKAPELEKLEKKFRKKGLSVIAISIDKTRDIWLKGLKEADFPGIPVFEKDGTKNIQQYNIVSIPYTFLVNSNGVILNVNTPLDSIRMKLEEELL
jgi:thiol-disulfide isomerase/thioredoxin